MSSRPWPLPLRYVVGVSLALLLALLAWSVRELFRPLVVAGLVAYILNPLVNLLKQRTGLPHRLAANLVFVLALLIALSAPAVFIPFVVENLQELSSSLLDTFNMVQDFIQQPLQVGVLTFHPQEISPDLSASIIEVIRAIPENALNILESASRNLAWTLVALVAVYYFLLDWSKLREGLIRMAPEPYRKDARRIYLEIKRIWGAYMRGTLALMGIVGMFFILAYLAVGLPGAVALGAIIGLLDVIPDVGPFVGALIAAFVAYVEGSLFLPVSNFWFMVIVMGLYGVFTGVKNLWLRPRIMGRSVHLHEGLVFIIIVAALVLQGVLGALIAVPVVASAQVVVGYLKRRVLGEAPFGAPLVSLRTYDLPPSLTLRKFTQDESNER